MSTDEFWNLTPLEFSFISQAYYDDEHIKRKDSWDQIRILSYYVYSSIPKGKSRNPSYKQFCIDYMPMPWDKISKDELEFETLDDAENQPLSPNDWKNIISNMKVVESKKITASNATNI